MFNLVSNIGDVMEAMRVLNEGMDDHPSLAERISRAHAFYVVRENDEQPVFGFSKFVGYEGLTAEDYLAHAQALDGRNTEHALSKWFEELRYDTPAYNQLLRKLSAWMARHGKRPRNGVSQKVRLMILRPEFRDREQAVRDDRRLLDLLIAVADMLPSPQRHELRASL